jgi:hypothetical protein
MNFTPWETINEAINAGAKYWSVYDQSGKRLIFELNQDTAPEDSAQKLQSILQREQGEFVQVKLSFQNSKDKGNGGNVRGFTYFYKLPNPGGMIGAPVNYSGAQMSGGIGMGEYMQALEAKNRAERELLKMELTQNQQPSFVERIATPENVNKFFEIAGALVNSLKKTSPPVAMQTATTATNLLAGYNEQEIDQELINSVNIITDFPDGRQAIINIAAAGPVVWTMIQTGLKDNNLLP